MSRANPNHWCGISKILNKDKDHEGTLWDRYEESGGLPDRNALVTWHLPLVRMIADKMASKMVSKVTAADIFSLGVQGLIQCITKFDRSRGFIFNSYARLRIRGSILDGLRIDDWVPRLVRVNRAKMNQWEVEALNAIGHNPTDIELAEFLNISMKELDGLVRESSVSMVLSTSGRGSDIEERNYNAQDYALEYALRDQQAVDPLTRIQGSDFLRFLSKYLDKRERIIIESHYWDGLTFKVIGELLGITESRVCQIHRVIKSKLSECLRDYNQGVGPKTILSDPSIMR